MPNPTQPKPTPTPAVLVYGKPTSPDLPQASWFRAEDRPTVVAAAQSLKFAFLDIQTEVERALTLGVHEGVLKGNGRMIVGSVAPEVYKRIEEYATKMPPAPAATATSDAAAAETKPVQEQTTNNSEPASPASSAASAIGKVSAASPNPVAAPATNRETAAQPNPWETLRVGARVLAAYWNEEREFEGFWLATVKRIEKGEFTLEWVEEPEYPPFKSRPKNIAVPHPEFRASGK